MPKVPVYESQVGLPQRATTDVPQGGAGVVGEAARRLGQEVQRMGVDLLDRAQTIEKQREERNLLRAETDLRESMRDVMQGALSLKGDEAADAAELVEQSFVDISGKVSGQYQFSNPDIANRLQAKMMGLRESYLTQAYNHQAQQIQVAKEAIVKDTYSSALKDVGVAPLNDLLFQEVQDSVHASLENAFEGEDLINRIHGANEQLYLARVDAIRWSNPRLAAEKLEEWTDAGHIGKGLGISKRDALESDIHEHDVNTEYQGLRSLYGDDFKRAIDAADSIPDTSVRNAVLSTLKADLAYQKGQEQDRENDIDDHWVEKALFDPKSLTPEKIRNSDASTGTKEKILGMIQDGGPGKENRTDMGTWLTVAEGIEAGDITRPSQLTPYFDKLSNGDAKAFYEEVKKKKGQGGVSGDEINPVTGLKAIMDDEEVSPRKQVGFLKAWLRRVEIEERKAGEPIDAPRKMEIGEELLAERSSYSSWLGIPYPKTVLAFEDVGSTLKEELAGMKRAEAMQEEIDDILVNRGYALTEENRRRIYEANNAYFLEKYEAE